MVASNSLCLEKKTRLGKIFHYVNHASITDKSRHTTSNQNYLHFRGAQVEDIIV